MADKTTFIKLDRNIINWRWYGNPKVLSVFIWLIVKANIKEGHFQKDTIKRGSLVTSNAHIAEGCNITVDNARTALANLESTGEIVRTQRNHYQIITVVNYEFYQTGIIKTGEEIPSNPDGKSQATAMANPNNQIIKEYNNGKNRKKRSLRSVSSSEDKTGYHCGKSGNLKPREVGTVDDIPEIYRSMYKTYPEYYDARNS